MGFDTLPGTPHAARAYSWVSLPSGRPSVSEKIGGWFCVVAHENPRWGYRRYREIASELRRLCLHAS